MSIRNSPQLTPQLLDAARANARRSHGPRTAAGKHNSRMNGVKHGERSDPENHYEVMRALGEDPAQFEVLKQELRDSFGSGDGRFEKQVDDLARLYWRRDRLERSQTGLMRRALLAVEEQQHRRRKEIEGASFEVGQAINISMQAPADPAARLRLLFSFLGVIREQVRSRAFHAWHASELAGFCEKRGGWRAARLCHLLCVFAESASRMPEDGAGQEPPVEEADEPQYKELLQLLEEEMASVEEEFEYEEKLNEERAAIERDACLAPSGEEWKLMLRREETLDRSIDRKIKLLLSLRKAAAQTQKPQTLESRSAPAEDVGAPPVGAQVGQKGRPYSEPAVREAKIDDRSGNVDENKGKVWETAGTCVQETDATGIGPDDNLSAPALQNGD